MNIPKNGRVVVIDDEEKEANKIAKQAESGSLGLKRTGKEDKSEKGIKGAVMSYNVRK